MDINRIAVLIPAYNEQKTIRTIVERCLRYTAHVVVVNDGSTDNTAAMVSKTPATLYSNSVNLGKGATLLQGFKIVNQQQYTGTIAIDADGQHNPDDLPRFFEVIEQFPEALIIGARRRSTQRAPKKRLYANKIADFFISCAARKRLSDTQSGFRYYPASFLTRIVSASSISTRFAFEAEVLISAVRAGVAVHYVDIESTYPIDARASHYCPKKDTWEIVKSVARLIFS